MRQGKATGTGDGEGRCVPFSTYKERTRAGNLNGCDELHSMRVQ